MSITNIIFQSKLWGMNSTYKYDGTAFVIFESHSFDQQASVADDL